MTWFAVHALVAYKTRTPSWPITVSENIFLVEANNAGEAASEGTRLAMQEVSVDDGLTIDGESATRTLVGIRKVINVSNPEPFDLDQAAPVSGTELTYSEYEVSTDEDLQRLIRGQAVQLRYMD